MATADPRGQPLTGQAAADGGDSASDRGALVEAKETATASAQKAMGFWTKISEDWVMNFSGMLAYNYLIAIAPLVLALLAIAGFVLGALSPEAYQAFVKQVAAALPGGVGHSLINGILTKLSESAGFLLAVAIVTGIFSGSRLFVSLENCFAVIYRVGNRKIVRQNVVAVLMTLLFIALAPLTFFASSITAAVLRLIVPSGIQRNGFVEGVEGFLSGVLVAFIMFAAIYYVTPNLKLGWKTVWPGALFAAALINLYEVLFPIYQQLFLKNAGYGSVVGLAIIFLIFLYYIGFISLLGAEMNAWVAGLRPLGRTLPELFREEQKESTGAETNATA